MPPMMQLKRVHTMFVVRNAVCIADGDGFSSLKREAALAAALLHDTGRYEQLKRYDTLQDSKAVDHTVFSMMTRRPARTGCCVGWRSLVE